MSISLGGRDKEVRQEEESRMYVPYDSSRFDDRTGMSVPCSEDCELYQGRQIEEKEALLESGEQFGVTVVYAIDWTGIETQMDLDDIWEQTALHILVVGFVVRDDYDYLCMSQQIFDDKRNTLRSTIIIPKQCILLRHDFEIGEQDGKLVKQSQESSDHDCRCCNSSCHRVHPVLGGN